MLVNKCKNSVFCVFFCLCFLVCTICGVFCFRCSWVFARGLDTCAVWRISTVDASMLITVLTWLRPLLIAYALSLHPAGHRFVFFLIVVRGFLLAYLYSSVCFARNDLLLLTAKEIVILPLFYWLCQWAYFRWDVSCHVR